MRRQITWLPWSPHALKDPIADHVVAEVVVLLRDVEADVGDDGHFAKAAAVRNASGRMGDFSSTRIGLHALRLVLAVDVVTADLLVQRDEFFYADLACVERIETVLDADVVVRRLRIANWVRRVRRTSSKYGDVEILQRAADAGRG